jgi:integrase
MGYYKGISKKKMKDNSISIMVRFKHQSITYPIKNFTKLFGCRTEKDAFLKLGEIRSLISKGIDPFATSYNNLNEIFKARVELNLRTGYWAISTAKKYQYFFNKYISPAIGKMKIEKIKYEKIIQILNSFNEDQISSRNSIIDILTPIFKEEYKKGNILENVMDKVEVSHVVVKRRDLSERTESSLVEIARSLYNAIPLYDSSLKSNIEQHQMFLYMILLTAHRYGELNQLEKKHCDIKNKKIITPKEITKTREEYHFPIPDECLDFIKNAPDGKLFNIPRGGTAGRVFHRLLMKAGIETINNHSISMHDTRRLMLSIMIKNLDIDSRLADYCLEHKQQGTIKHYLNLDYEAKVKCYQKYWNFIRTGETEVKAEVEENQKIENDKPMDNFERLVKFTEMYEKKLITKEQFETQRDKLLN